MSRFITDTVNIYGFCQVTEGSNAKTRTNAPALYTAIPCCIQPAGDNIFSLFPDGIEAARAFVIYIPDTSLVIKNGYQLVDQLGREYIVRGVPEVWNNPYTSLSHIKVAVERAVEY